jgi:DNA-binding response OmpR family regulator
MAHAERPVERLASVMVPAVAHKTILICEDEEALRELVRAILGPDYTFAEASEGDEALALIRDLRPDLVVLDLMLPGKSGLEVLSELRSDSASDGTPVVVVTAWTHAEEAVLAAGADRFISKPFEPDTLQSTVEELLAAS